MVVQSVDDPGRMADLVASNLTLKVPEAQALLELDDSMQRLTRVNQTLEKEIGILEVQSQIQNKAREEMSKTQRDYYLREQLRQIKIRAGRRRRPRRGDRGAARRRSRGPGCPTRRATEADKQLRRLEQMHAESAEAAVLRTLPRVADRAAVERPPARTCSTSRRRAGSSTRTTTTSSTSRIASSTTWPSASCAAARTARSSASWARPASARRRWAARSRGPWGASSCASRWAACATRPRSAATAAPTSARLPGRHHPGAEAGRHQQPGPAARRGRQAGRRLPRRSVGGAARGAGPRAEPHLPRPLPGRALRSLEGPVHRHREPARDGIPAPLRDRMETLRLAGYSEEEKLAIAERYLVPKQITEAGLTAKEIVDRPRRHPPVVSEYTREAGLRELERLMARWRARSPAASSRRGGRSRRGHRQAAQPGDILRRRSCRRSWDRRATSPRSATPPPRSAPSTASPGPPTAARCCTSRRRRWRAAGP